MRKNMESGSAQVRAENRKQAEKLSRALNWAAAGVSVLFFFHRRWYTLILCLGCMITALVAAGLWPEYFMVIHPRKDPKRPNQKKPKQAELDMAIVLPGLAVGLTIGGTMLEAKPVLLFAGAGTVLLGAGFLLIREFRQNMGRFLCGLVIGFMILVAAVCQINVLFDFDVPETVLVEVTDMRVENNSRGADRYFCTVLTPEGEVEIKVSGGIYNQISMGDLVYYHYSVGALGIPYGQIMLTEG